MIDVIEAETWQTIAALVIVAWAASWIVFKLGWPGQPSNGCGSCGQCPKQSQQANPLQLHQINGADHQSKFRI